MEQTRAYTLIALLQALKHMLKLSERVLAIRAFYGRN